MLEWKRNIEGSRIKPIPLFIPLDSTLSIPDPDSGTQRLIAIGIGGDTSDESHTVHCTKQSQTDEGVVLYSLIHLAHSSLPLLPR